MDKESLNNLINESFEEQCISKIELNKSILNTLAMLTLLIQALVNKGNFTEEEMLDILSEDKVKEIYDIFKQKQDPNNLDGENITSKQEMEEK